MVGLAKARPNYVKLQSIKELLKHKACLVGYYSINTRVESGSDDPDNVCHLSHFCDGSSGSHPQTKLST